MLIKGLKLKTNTVKSHSKKKTSGKLKTLSLKGRIAKKKLPLAKNPFFSSEPVDLGVTNNSLIDELLYGKKSA